MREDCLFRRAGLFVLDNKYATINATTAPIEATTIRISPIGKIAISKVIEKKCPNRNPIQPAIKSKANRRASPPTIRWKMDEMSVATMKANVN